MEYERQKQGRARSDIRRPGKRQSNMRRLASSVKIAWVAKSKRRDGGVAYESGKRRAKRKRAKAQKSSQLKQTRKEMREAPCRWCSEGVGVLVGQMCAKKMGWK